MKKSKLVTSRITAVATAGAIVATGAAVLPQNLAAQSDLPNILVVWGDDIGQSNISAYTMGMVGYHTPNIDRIACGELGKK